MHTLAHLEVGSVFASDFRVLRRLSQGGMGTVYVVEQLSTGKQRALKLMLPQLVSDVSLRKRFEQEARVGARIESEHVVDVVGAGVDPATGTPWLAMELLQGEDLATRVQRAGALPPDELRLVLGQVCHAIAAAHDAGVVHRDLKPENIFLAQARRAEVKTTVKVLDFGIAKLVADARTTATAAIGSPSWMAPEQTARGSAIGPSADIWPIGLIAFFLLTGHHYFRAAEDESSTLAVLLREVVLDPLPLASQRALELGVVLPPGFDSWFSRAVVRDPAARFGSVRELLGSFEHLFAVSGSAPTAYPTYEAWRQAPGPGQTLLDDAVSPAAPRAVSTTAGFEATPVVRRSSRAPLYALSAVGVLVLALGGTALALWRTSTASSPGALTGTPTGGASIPLAPSALSSSSSSTPSASASPSSAASQDIPVVPVESPPSTPKPSQPSRPLSPSSPEPARPAPTTPNPKQPQPELLPPSPMLPSRPASPTPTSPTPPLPVPPTPFEPSPSQPNLPDLPASPFRRRGEQGALNINSNPSCDVYLDGRLLGATPLARVSASGGSHTLRFANAAEGINKTISVTVTPGETREVFRRFGQRGRFRD